MVAQGCCKLGRQGTLPVCPVWPSGRAGSNLASVVRAVCGISYLYSMSGGKISSIGSQLSALVPKVPLQHLSEGFSRTCNLSRAFGSPGTRGRFGFLRLLKWMELVTSWKHNGSHCHSHPLSCTRTNPPKPKGTVGNTSFVFRAGSQGRLIERHK